MDRNNMRYVVCISHYLHYLFLGNMEYRLFIQIRSQNSITIFSHDIYFPISYKNQNSAPTGLQKRAPIPYYAQHEELIRYIHEAWHKVSNSFVTTEIIY